jgi:hypothetical protein
MLEAFGKGMKGLNKKKKVQENRGGTWCRKGENPVI